LEVVEMCEHVPALLTVEEAAVLLRVGRTKAYAMTQEWRASGARSGLPVVDFGNVLRVPRQALEELLGVDLTTVGEVQAQVARAPAVERAGAAAADGSARGVQDSAPVTASVAKHKKGARRVPPAQAALFDA
jgi:excisionase family DNA binding protein